MGVFSRKEQNGAPDDDGASTHDDGAAAQVAAAEEAIAAFWQWWLTGGRAEAADIFGGNGDQARFDALGDALGERVKAIGDLAMATGPGRAAKHCLVLTAGGNPQLRPLAAAWLAAAPPADEDFEYADHRQPYLEPESLRLRFEGGELDLASTSVVTVVEPPLVHVQVCHPLFAELGDDDRAQVAFLFLDAVLGERVVEERLGQVATAASHDEGTSPVSILELPAVLASAG